MCTWRMCKHTNIPKTGERCRNGDLGTKKLGLRRKGVNRAKGTQIQRT